MAVRQHVVDGAVPLQDLVEGEHAHGRDEGDRSGHHGAGRSVADGQSLQALQVQGDELQEALGVAEG